jgi:L-alanine-DL-glutamate epimerase-like enolase superfamily enzyme
VEGSDALSVTATWSAMGRALRNAGRPGIGSEAIAAVDTALWDLKARLVGVPLATLLDAAHDRVPVYGSGGFTSYSDERLAAQLGGWAAEGIPRVKMKVGREPERDVRRVELAREAIGQEVELFIDANGALTRKRALHFAERYAELDVRWFEEPVSSDDLEGLRLLRDRAPAGMEIAAGEYGYMLPYFERMLEAGAVDCLQADVTRCEGITGFLQVAALCEARSLDLSAHCGPSIHAHPCCAVARLRHLEYFHDHVRVERLLFDGVLEPVDGCLLPDLSRPGNGLELKRADAERYAA